MDLPSALAVQVDKSLRKQDFAVLVLTCYCSRLQDQIEASLLGVPCLQTMIRIPTYALKETALHLLQP